MTKLVQCLPNMEEATGPSTHGGGEVYTCNSSILKIQAGRLDG